MTSPLIPLHTSWSTPYHILSFTPFAGQIQIVVLYQQSTVASLHHVTTLILRIHTVQSSCYHRLPHLRRHHHPPLLAVVPYTDLVLHLLRNRRFLYVSSDNRLFSCLRTNDLQQSKSSDLLPEETPQVKVLTSP